MKAFEGQYCTAGMDPMAEKRPPGFTPSDPRFWGGSKGDKNFSLYW